MNKITVRKKINDLEAEISLLKRAIRQEPDFSIDEANWKKIKPHLKKVRKQLYKEVYGKS